MKHIKVVAAVIHRGNKILATQRGYGEWKGWWEFPGGKIEEGEEATGALIREIHEELDAEIKVERFLKTVEWDYPAFHLTLNCYWCSLTTDSIHLNEHESARWLSKDELNSVKWLPADISILKEIAAELA